jgi:hypothetical protein
MRQPLYRACNEQPISNLNTPEVCHFVIYFLQGTISQSSFCLILIIQQIIQRPGCANTTYLNYFFRTHRASERRQGRRRDPPKQIELLPFLSRDNCGPVHQVQRIGRKFPWPHVKLKRNKVREPSDDAFTYDHQCATTFCR